MQIIEPHRRLLRPPPLFVAKSPLIVRRKPGIIWRLRYEEALERLGELRLYNDARFWCPPYQRGLDIDETFWFATDTQQKISGTAATYNVPSGTAGCQQIICRAYGGGATGGVGGAASGFGCGGGASGSWGEDIRNATLGQFISGTATYTVAAAPVTPTTNNSVGNPGNDTTITGAYTGTSNPTLTANGGNGGSDGVSNGNGGTGVASSGFNSKSTTGTTGGTGGSAPRDGGDGGDSPTASGSPLGGVGALGGAGGQAATSFPGQTGNVPGAGGGGGSHTTITASRPAGGGTRGEIYFIALLPVFGAPSVNIINQAINRASRF